MSSDQPSGHLRRKSWRLRTRLATGLAVLFVAILGLVAYSHFQYLSDRRDARTEDMQRVSQTIAAYFDGLATDLESFSLSTVVTLGEARVTADQSVPEDRRATVNEYLQHLFESYGLLRAIFITDTDGTVIFDNGGNSYGLDLSHRGYIQALQNGADEYWSNGFPGSQSGEMIISHSRTIADTDGNTLGYFVVALEASALTSRLPENLASGQVSILDGNGTVVLHQSDTPVAPIGTDLSGWEALQEARTGGLLVEDEAVPLVAGDSYTSLVPLENLGWVVGYSLPSSEIEGGTTGLFLRDMALLGAIVLAAFVVAWLFASRMVQPLTRLTGIAAAISRGDKTEEPANIDSGNAEVLLLAETMGQMRRSIQEREEQLRAQNHALAVIERFGESLASELDLERSIQAITNAGVDLVDAQAVQFLYREPDGRQRIAIAGPRPGLAVPEDHAVVREVLAGNLVDVRDLQDGERGAGRHNTGVDAARSVLGIPIRSRTNEVEGAILMLHSAVGAYTAQHERLATGLARWASIVLENARLYASSQELITELERSNASKDDFLGIVSHELRTPITTIYGGTLLLRLRRESLPEQAFNDMIVSIAEEAERLHHLVEDLLAIARTELVKELRPVEVPEVVSTAIADFSTTHRRTIDVKIEPDLPQAIGDSTYFRQVLTNLISNADKYTPSDEPLSVSAGYVDGEIAVRVKDNGPGVAESDLPHIFESFYRAEGAREKATGSGLGLTVCKRLVEALGGRIWAQNRPEGGLEVGFTLRAQQEVPQTVIIGSGTNGDATPEQGLAEGTPPANGNAS